MFKIGLCSVTFRQLSVEAIIELGQQAGLDGIEWGGDKHVQPGDLQRAKEVAELTKQAHMAVTSYGSYYRVDHPDANDVSFETILETAAALNAPYIRVRAGSLGSDEANTSDRNKVIDDARKIGDLAQKENISVHFEYHGGTLTDTKESAKRLMEAVDHSNVFIYWQPAVDESVDNRLQSIVDITPWLSYVHVFYWAVRERMPFSDGQDEWRKYLKQLATQEQTRYLLMEFVKNDDPEQFLSDIETLKHLLQHIQ